MTQPGRALYTAKTHTTGGRENGAARSSDGQLDVRLSPPGSNRPGTNPEQLFAAGWSACFEGAIGFAARALKVSLPDSVAVDAEVDLCRDDTGHFIQARLHVSIPGIDREVAQSILEMAHQNCVYSKAIRGNVNVLVDLA